MKIDRPIIFIGFPRSGTTIISEILFQHESLAWPSNYQEQFPRSVSVNKIRRVLDNNLWRLKGQKPQLNKIKWYNKLAFKPTEAYQFWEYLSGSEVEFSTSFLLGEKADSERIGFIRHHFEKLVAYQHRTRLAFKLTGPGRISYLHSIFPDAIFIEIYREPFAAISSLLKVPFWKDKCHRLYWEGAYNEEELDLATTWRDRPDLLAALQFKKVRDTIQEEIRDTNIEYHSFSYEHFIENSRSVISDILELSELRPHSNGINSYFEENTIYKKRKTVDELFSPKAQSEIKNILGSELI